MNDENASQKLNDQEKRISMLEHTLEKGFEAIKDHTKAVNELSAQFAVYAFRHDKIEQDVREQEKEQRLHSKEIAAMKPVVDGLRTLVWRMIAASLTGGVAAVAIAQAIAQATTK